MGELGGSEVVQQSFGLKETRETMLGAKTWIDLEANSWKIAFFLQMGDVLRW